jgi:rhamnulokinase
MKETMEIIRNPIHLAVDLGASSGRVLAGYLQDSAVVLEELHRFENGPRQLGRRLVWNLVGLWDQIQIGLQTAAQRFGDRIASVGVDTWGVDYVLLDRNDDLVGPAFSYRDARTQGMMNQAFRRMSRQEIFHHTGLKFMELNTAYQLLSMRIDRSPLLDIAEHFLMIPDYLHFLLCGQKCNEFTNASTTQLLDPRNCDWCQPVIQALQIPAKIFQRPIQPGSVLGTLTSEVSQRTQLNRNVKVVAPATHDTGSAVLAVPAQSFAQARSDWCYISCGTWSLMGMELAEPNLSQACQKYNFTNEGGVAGSVRLLKNISGLWIVQQCREQWRREGRDLGWSELSRMASQATSMTAVIDPDDPTFSAPADMPKAIRQFCKRTGQREPQNEGEVIRCALESLALRYRMVLEMLEEIVGVELKVVHIVGGGVRNQLLCQLAADACGLPVVAGPVEATALGNILMQAVGCGELQGVDQARALVRASPDIIHYQPKQDTATVALWKHGLNLLKQLTEGK